MAHKYPPLTKNSGSPSGRYPKYNVVAKKLYRRFEALGAGMLLPVGGFKGERGQGRNVWNVLTCAACILCSRAGGSVDAIK